MFGYVLVNKPELKIKDYEIYRSFYCGLCHTLKREFGELSRFTLNYDMTFLAILLTGLYEPDTIQEQKVCILHPLHKYCMYRNEYIDYAAQMTIVLTYLKCADNWHDEHSYSSYTYQKVLKHKYEKVREKYPDKVKVIEESLRQIGELEDQNNFDLDLLSSLTGKFMAEIVCYKHDEWEVQLRKMADYLGRFIYLLDAYDDYEEDIKKQCFNPLVNEAKREDFNERMRMILEMMIATSCEAFEILPIIEYEDILRNILYSGVWAKFEQVYKKRIGDDNA